VGVRKDFFLVRPAGPLEGLTNVRLVILISAASKILSSKNVTFLASIRAITGLLFTALIIALSFVHLRRTAS
jgi:hypothetical protein